MPSNSGKAVFKSRSILKSKPKTRISKQEKNKENSTGNNAQFQYEVKPPRKPKSMIPKPSSKLNNSKNSRKGEFHKYIVENQNKNQKIPIKISSRRGSTNTVSSKGIKKNNISKTEMLYQKARSALGKSKKAKSKKNC